jgi:hypothetical protein
VVGDGVELVLLGGGLGGGLGGFLCAFILLWIRIARCREVRIVLTVTLSTS